MSKRVFLYVEVGFFPTNLDGFFLFYITYKIIYIVC